MAKGGEARLQTEAFKDSLTRVGGCRGFFGDNGRRIGKRAGNRHAVPGFWEENSSRRGGSV